MFCLSNKKILFIFCLILVVSLFETIVSRTTSPFFAESSLDSYVFQSIGMSVLKGKIPYIDLFDHKGPFLYFIELVGLCISKFWGIWLLQVFFLLITLYLWVKTLDLFCDSVFLKTITIGLSLILLFAFETGNVTEEWCLPFVSYSIYVCLKSIRETSYSISYINVLIIGLCFGFVALIRLNNFMPVMGFLLYLLWMNIKEGHYKYIVKVVMIILGGIIIATLPFFLWFYYKAGADGVYEMLFGTFLFNMEYMKYANGSLNVLYMLKCFIPVIFMFIASIVCGKGCIPQLIPLCASYLLCTMTTGHFLFRHYFILFIPLMIVTLGLILKDKNRMFLAACIVCVGATAINPMVRLYDYFFNMRWHECLERREQFASIVNRHIPFEMRDSIWNYNADCSLDLLLSIGVVQSNRIILSYQTDVSEHLASEKEAFVIRRPQYVIMSKNRKVLEPDKSYIEKNYIRIDSTSVQGTGEDVVLLSFK